MVGVGSYLGAEVEGGAETTPHFWFELQGEGWPGSQGNTSLPSCWAPMDTGAPRATPSWGPSCRWPFPSAHLTLSLPPRLPAVPSRVPMGSCDGSNCVAPNLPRSHPCTSEWDTH